MSNEPKPARGCLWSFSVWCVSAVLCFFAFCVLLSLAIRFDNVHYPKVTAKQTQNNVPLYFEKISEILQNHDIPLGTVAIDNEGFISGVAHGANSDIRISLTNYYGYEELALSFDKDYRNVEALTDMQPPFTEEYDVICEIMQSIAGKNQTPLSTDSISSYVREIFDYDKLFEQQSAFEYSQFFQIDYSERFAHDCGSFKVCLYPESLKTGTLHFSINYTLAID